MPKEDINKDTPTLRVHWDANGGSVQVAIDFSRETWLDCVQDIEADTDLKSYAIYTGSLSRQDINKLIRVLRRARDGAHGKDE